MWSHALQSLVVVLAIALWSWRRRLRRDKSREELSPLRSFPGFHEWFLKFCPQEEIGASGVLSASSGPTQIHVAYASDHKNFPGLLGSMLSLGRHLAVSSECWIHVFVPEGDLARAGDLRDCFYRELGGLPVKPTLLLYAAPKPRFLIGSLPLFPRWVSPLTFARYYLHEHISAPTGRVLWLDTDTVVKADLAPLFRMPMEDHPIAASWDLDIRWTKHYIEESPGLRDLFRNASAPTFNAGVLLINLDMWRGGGFTRSLEQWTVLTRGHWGDQLALNLEFQGRFLQLDWRWNRGGVCLWPEERLPEPCIAEAKILHLNGLTKPWVSPTACEKSTDTFRGLYDQCTSITAVA